MAIIHKATLTPRKPDLISAWLDGRSWAGQGSTEVLGTYRFDDPAGEVGVEVFLLRRGERLLHLPLTYRGAPLPDHGDHLVGTLEHPVLGTRWVYDGSADEVALACFRRAIEGEQEQAELEVWDQGRVVEHRPQQVLIFRETGGEREGSGGSGKDQVLLTRVLGEEPGGTRRLQARYGDQQWVVAALA
ncbi:maltokinase N-terminal cap-like domain-containing protein [Nocardiopsis metallicus]|uniref:Maltokinase N-terminal cap domain-containing protein n=1 Tax=Nocardiopsis metallicus TaxID=179819 RepID=A0A840W1R5_9ACTN|nr:hypothetical protein [Nocardiopsis metallicus]MBB5490790.1 hypothetical protein [Nocardiopsis metallicus]